MKGGEVGGVIAASASAEIALRLVKENAPAKMAERVIAHIRAQGYFIVDKDPDAATLAGHPRVAKVIARVNSGGSGAWRTDPSTPAVGFAADALRRQWGADPVRVRTLGGGVPAAPFIEVFHVPISLVCRSPTTTTTSTRTNENLRLGNLSLGRHRLACRDHDALNRELRSTHARRSSANPRRRG